MKNGFLVWLILGVLYAAPLEAASVIFTMAFESGKTPSVVTLEKLPSDYSRGGTHYDFLTNTVFAVKGDIAAGDEQATVASDGDEITCVVFPASSNQTECTLTTTADVGAGTLFTAGSYRVTLYEAGPSIISSKTVVLDEEAKMDNK